MIFYLSIPAETITKSLWKHALCVGSNPTRSIFIHLVNYGIVLSLISVIVGQIQQQCTCYILPYKITDTNPGLLLLLSTSYELHIQLPIPLLQRLGLF